MYVYACMIEENRTHDQDRHTARTHDNRKREDSGKAGKPEYICMIIDNEKKVQKKLKKIWKYEKDAVSLYP